MSHCLHLISEPCNEYTRYLSSYKFTLYDCEPEEDEQDWNASKLTDHMTILRGQLKQFVEQERITLDI